MAYAGRFPKFYLRVFANERSLRCLFFVIQWLKHGIQLPLVVHILPFFEGFFRGRLPVDFNYVPGWYQHFEVILLLEDGIAQTISGPDKWVESIVVIHSSPSV